MSQSSKTTPTPNPVLTSCKARLETLKSRHPAQGENQALEEYFKQASTLFDKELQAKPATSSAKAQRNADLLLGLDVLFLAGDVCVHWLEDAYTNKLGDGNVDIMLKVLRVVPIHISDLLKHASKAKDKRFKLDVYHLCVSNAQLATHGRRCGDVPAMSHILDLVYHLNKLKLSIAKTNPESLEDAESTTSEWISQFHGGNMSQASTGELERQLLSCTTSTAFAQLTAQLIHTAEYEKDGEPTMNLQLAHVALQVRGFVCVCVFLCSVTS
jgi:hypothetical protein